MEELELRLGDARLRIAMLGAECRSWSIGTRELLWDRDARFWDGVAPILFPVCGWTRDGKVRLGKTTYPLGLHGFARACRFSIADAGANHVRLLLRDSADTMALFPFAFELAVEYWLGPNSLAIKGHVRNRGRVPIPYAFGLHPGFRYDPALPARVIFDVRERPDVPIIAPGGLFSTERRPIRLNGRILDIGPETFEREALCFVPAASRALIFEHGDDERLRVEYPGFNNLVLWSRPQAPFLCIEPWTGYGDPDGFSGELYEKPGMKLLAPGVSADHGAEFSVIA